MNYMKTLKETCLEVLQKSKIGECASVDSHYVLANYHLGTTKLTFSQIIINESFNYFSIGWNLSKSYNLIEEFILRFPENFLRTQVDKTISYTVSINEVDFYNQIEDQYPNIENNRFDLSLEGIKEFRAYSMDLINRMYVPLADSMDDINFLNTYLNNGIKTLSGTYLAPEFKRAIISKLADSNEWKKLIKDLQREILNRIAKVSENPRFKKYESYQRIFEDFVLYLEMLQPLKNPDLFSEENAIT